MDLKHLNLIDEINLISTKQILTKNIDKSNLLHLFKRLV